MVHQSLIEIRNDFLKLCKKCNISTKDTELENKYRGIEINYDNFKGIILLLNADSDHTIKEWIRSAIKLTKNYTKVILLVTGEDVSGEDCQYADQYDVIIWEKEHLDVLLENFLDDEEDAIAKVLGELGISSYLDPNFDYKSPSMIGD